MVKNEGHSPSRNDAPGPGVGGGQDTGSVSAEAWVGGLSAKQGPETRQPARGLERLPGSLLSP